MYNANRERTTNTCNCPLNTTQKQKDLETGTPNNTGDEFGCR